MNKILMNVFCNIKENLKSKNREFDNDGFSLLELILAMAVLVVLTTSVSLSASAVKENAKNAAVEKAVSAVFQKAMVNESDSLDETTAQSAADEWNNSRQRDDVTVNAESDEDGNVFVNASYKGVEDSEIYRAGSIYGSLCVNGTVTAGDDIGKSCSPGQGVGVPEPGNPISDTVTTMTYNCDATTTGYLSVSDVVAGTKITVSGDDGSLKKVNFGQEYSADTDTNGIIAEKFRMKSGTKYKLIVNGQFKTLRTPVPTDGVSTLKDCLVSVDRIGADSGVTKIGEFGGAKLTGVPDTIPSTVTSLMRLVKDAKSFNDPNIKKWDVSNVTSFYAAFYEADAFNQNLNDWNVSKGVNMYALFYGTDLFDQPLDKWDVSNVTNMQSMFHNTKSFNQDISMWKIDKLKTMNSMFYNSQKFNQPLNSWDTSKVTNMYRTFLAAQAFDKPLDKWDTSSVTDMSEMFKNTKEFNQNISGWNVSNVSTWNDFYTGAAKLTSSNIPSKMR